ncbi:MAG: hypothetical protein U9N61_03045 [Euryarchaeota archaeon]|nr:hypothetical protein [Euryarchaeota archaeon]
MITASVYNELLKTKEHGFDFLDEIIQSDIGLINIRKEEKRVFEDFLQDYRIHWGGGGRNRDWVVHEMGISNVFVVC